MGGSNSKQPATFADKVILSQFAPERTLSSITMPQLCGYLLLGVPNAQMPILPKRWRRRYFVLRDDRLECYAGNQASSRLICTFNIRGCTVDAAGAGKKSRLRFGISSNDVTWLHLIADSEGLKQVWMKAIRAAADRKFANISKQLLSEVGRDGGASNSANGTPADPAAGSGGAGGGGGVGTARVRGNGEESSSHDDDISKPLFMRQESYDIQTASEVADAMEASVNSAASAMHVTPVKARELLAKHDWDFKDLIKDVLEPSNRTKALQEEAAAAAAAGAAAAANKGPPPGVDARTAALAAAHAAAAAAAAAANEGGDGGEGADKPSDVPAAAAAEANAEEEDDDDDDGDGAMPLPDDEEGECLICEEEFEASEFPQLGCGCKVCKGCLSEHATAFIEAEGRNAAIVGCPTCREPVGDDVVQALIPSQLAAKWRHFKALRYVDQNPKVKWCIKGCG